MPGQAKECVRGQMSWLMIKKRTGNRSGTGNNKSIRHPNFPPAEQSVDDPVWMVEGVDPQVAIAQPTTSRRHQDSWRFSVPSSRFGVSATAHLHPMMR